MPTQLPLPADTEESILLGDQSVRPESTTNPAALPLEVPSGPGLAAAAAAADALLCRAL